MLIKSGQPEILRAARRDETFLEHLYNSSTEVIQAIIGIRTWIKYRKVFRIISDFTYYLFTTLSNLQTLGEEYTGILQTHSSGKSLQKKHVQTLMILLNLCGEGVVIDLLKRFEKYVRNLPEDHPMRLEARQKLLLVSENVRHSIPFIQRLHKAIFYLNGSYYEFGKRLTSTRYILVRHWLRDRSSLPGFQLLGIISLISLALNMFSLCVKLKKLDSSTQVEKSETNRATDVVSNEDKCSLCLNIRRNTSATSCSHLFCWDCIIPWLQEQPQCPLCRSVVRPSRVVMLQNY